MGKGRADVEGLVVVKRKRDCNTEASVQESFIVLSPVCQRLHETRYDNKLRITNQTHRIVRDRLSSGHFARLVSESYAFKLMICSILDNIKLPNASPLQSDSTCLPIRQTCCPTVLHVLLTESLTSKAIA